MCVTFGEFHFISGALAGVAATIIALWYLGGKEVR
jgi:hypothetical protein